MDFGFGIEVEPAFQAFAWTVADLGERCKEALSTRSFGDGVESIIVGVLIYQERNKFNAPRKPFYKKLEQFKDAYGLHHTIRGLIAFDVALFQDEVPGRSFTKDYFIAELKKAADVIVAMEKRYPKFRAREFVAELSAALDACR